MLELTLHLLWNVIWPSALILRLLLPSSWGHWGAIQVKAFNTESHFMLRKTRQLVSHCISGATLILPKSLVKSLTWWLMTAEQELGWAWNENPDVDKYFGKRSSNHFNSETSTSTSSKKIRLCYEGGKGSAATTDTKWQARQYMYEPFFAFFNNVFVSFVAFYSFLSIGLQLPVIVFFW